ncbi:hypothetical protein Nmel_012301, partial [Mimus melanotis]
PALSSPQFFVPASPSTTCCEAAPRSGPDASSAPAAASLCCAPYESRLLAPGRAELNAALGMYSAPYAAGQGYGNYLPYGAEPAALYTALNPQYEIKDGAGTLHSGIAQPATYYSYDHSLGQYQYDRYGTVDFGGSARRKNATRETTSTLKTWLYEHRKNPYPTKGEKIMLAIITKMTLTQVSTWFANARRRLKKENKMTWSPKNKAGEERKEETSREEDEYSAEGEGRAEQKSYKEDKDLRFSDLEEEEEEEEEEAGKPEKGRTSSLQEAPSLGAALPEAPRSDCSLPGPFHAFPCAKAPAADELNATKPSVSSELSSQEPAQPGRNGPGHPPPGLGHGRGTPGQRVATGRRSRTLLVGHRRQEINLEYRVDFYMFTKGYSKRVGLPNWEPSGFAIGETIPSGKEELQVSAGRCEGAAPGFGPGNSHGPAREQSSPGYGDTGKESKLCRTLEDPGGEGRSVHTRAAGDGGAGSGAGPIGSPAADARPRGFPALRSSPGQGAAQQQQSVSVTRSLEKGKLSCEKINIISSRI